MLAPARSSLLIRTRLSLPGRLTRVFRSKGGTLWMPEYDHVVDPRNNCLAVLRRVMGPCAGQWQLVPGSNIITVAGNTHFAQKASGESPTNAFTTWEMASAGTPGGSANRSGFTPIASSQLAQDATYPKTSDGDSDNTGAGATVRTSRASYSAASFNNAAITHGLITNASPGGTEPILTGFAWASSINKTSADTLKVFHNATCLGV